MKLFTVQGNGNGTNPTVATTVEELIRPGGDFAYPKGEAAIVVCPFPF